LDTVPEQGNLPGRIDGDTLHGLGASDMKSALAVMLELAEWLDREELATALDFGFLFFAREELPISESAVPHLFRRCPQLRDAELVLVMEPTDTTLQIGCLGNLKRPTCATPRRGSSSSAVTRSRRSSSRPASRLIAQSPATKSLDAALSGRLKAVDSLPFVERLPGFE